MHVHVRSDNKESPPLESTAKIEQYDWMTNDSTFKDHLSYSESKIIATFNNLDLYRF